MNKSREYLKSLTVEERKVLAKKVGVSQEYLYQISANIRNPHRELALRLEIETNERIKESDFDDEVRAAIA